MDVEALFPLYLDYVRQLREALTCPSGPQLSERFLIKPMSRAEFEACWKEMEQIHGAREKWAAKLKRGYEADSAEMRQRVAKALGERIRQRHAA